MKDEERTRELIVVPQFRERRRPEASQLRVWLDQIKTVEAMTQDEWITGQTYRDAFGVPPYLSKSTWLIYLREQALLAASRLYESIIAEAA